MRLRSKIALMATVLAISLAGVACGNDKNGACEPCSNQGDCDEGLTCQLFEGGKMLCGDDNPNMICPANR